MYFHWTLLLFFAYYVETNILQYFCGYWQDYKSNCSVCVTVAMTLSLNAQKMQWNNSVTPSKTQRTFQKREVNDQSAWRKSGIRGRSSFLRGWKWRQSSWSRGCGDSHYHIDLRQGLSLYKNSTKMTRWGVLIRGSDTISGQESDIFTSFPVPQPSPTAWGPGDGVRAGGEKLPESRT